MKLCLYTLWLSSLVAFTAETGDVVLRTERLTLKLSQKEKGAIVSLVDHKSGTEFIAVQAAPRLFVLSFSKKSEPGGTKFYLSNRDARKFNLTRQDDAVRQQVTMDYDGLGAWPVQVQCTARIAKGDPLVRWGMTVKIPDDLVLEETHYPLVVLRTPLGESVLDDAAVYGATKGGVIRQPGNLKAGTRISGRQPGSLAAQFGCYYDNRAGFYCAAYDDQGYPKEISLQRTKEGFECNWIHSSYATRTHTLGYEVVMTTYSGTDQDGVADWRDAADIYKAWALTKPWCATRFEQRTDIPGWMKEGPAMVRFSRHWLSKPEMIEKWMTQYWRKHFPQSPLITAYWGWEKIENWVTPDYFPLHPSDEQFTNLVTRLRPYNTHAFPWPSGYHWTLMFQKKADGTFAWDDRQRFDKVARSHAIHDRAGKLYVRTPSWLKGGDTACMCPGDPWTINWWNQDISVPLMQRGVEMIQVDQVVGGSFPACYERTHPHPPGPGKWMTDVFTRQLQTMYTACRQVNPGAMVCFEEPNERFNHLAGIQDYRDCEAPREWASVFNYLYHEYLPTFQSNPRGDDLVMAAYCLANGQIPHLVPSMNFGDAPALRNGGFEDMAGQPTLATGWDQVHEYQGREWNGKGYRDTTESHEGSASLCLENRQASDIVQVSQNIELDSKTVTAGRKYRLRAWMKTVTAARTNSINFGCFLASGKFASGGRLVMSPGKGWMQSSADFVMPTDAIRMRIMIHADNLMKMWVDDLVFEEVRSDGSTVPVRLSGEPPLHNFMKQWVALYHGEGRPYLEFGRMLHPPLLMCARITRNNFSLPAVQHNAYRGPDGSEAVILANATRDRQTATLRWQGRTQNVELAREEIRLIR